jgi:hypothetical protein
MMIRVIGVTASQYYIVDDRKENCMKVEDEDLKKNHSLIECLKNNFLIIHCHL